MTEEYYTLMERDEPAALTYCWALDTNITVGDARHTFGLPTHDDDGPEVSWVFRAKDGRIFTLYVLQQGDGVRVLAHRGQPALPNRPRVEVGGGGRAVRAGQRSLVQLLGHAPGA